MTVTQLLQLTVVNVVDNEIPGGAVDGKNTTFTLANPPNPPISLNLHVNGLLLHQGPDYTLAGAAITAAAYIPQPGDTILASYRH